MISKLNTYKNSIDFKESFLESCSIEEHKIKGKILDMSLNDFRIGTEYKQEFQTNKSEMKAYYKNNRRLRIPEKNKGEKALKHTNVIRFLRKSLCHKTVVAGRLIQHTRGGYFISFTGLFAFVPNSHLLLDKIKPKREICRVNSLPLEIISVKCFKNKYKVKSANVYKLSIVVSLKRLLRKINMRNKKSIIERISFLNKLDVTWK